MQTASSSTVAPPGRSAKQFGFRFAFAWFLVIQCVYHANLTFLRGDDATANIYLPVAVLRHGTMKFSPQQFPFMFTWSDDSGRTFFKVGWEHDAFQWPNSAGAPRENLRMSRENYYLTPAVNGSYASVFGIGAGLSALPLFAVANLFADFGQAPVSLFWTLGKFTASAAVAGSAVLVFLVAARFVSFGTALLVSTAYAFGTCVWSISSQTLWQHGPSEFFLALGCYFLLSGVTRRLFLAGVSFGLAVMCRPTNLPACAVIALWLFWTRRSEALAYVAGLLPPGLVIAVYNWRFLGSPFSFGQTERGHSIALEKTGSPDIWQTPLWEGLLGLLASPSRGLFIYSPFLVFAVWGAVAAWRNPKWQDFRPLPFCALALWMIAAKWFDWWGGWSYGYRPIVDTMPFLTLLLLPVMDRIMIGPMLRTAFALLLTWSISVQCIGAFGYDCATWNNRGGENIDLPQHRHRLWSIRDMQIMYCWRHLEEEYSRKMPIYGFESTFRQ